MNRRFRLIILFLLALLIAASGVSYASADGTSAYIFSSDGESTNLSNEPDDSPEYVIGSLPHGTPVVLTWISGDYEWGYIKYNDYISGYVPIADLSTSNAVFVSVLDDFTGTFIMYVCTVQGDSLNVRSGPGLTEDIIGSFANTSPVHVVDLYYTSDWASIKYGQEGGGSVPAFVANRYLSYYNDGIYRGEIYDDMLIDSSTPEPESTPEPTPTPKPKSEEMSPKELIAELRTAKTIAEPFTVLVHPSHPTGRVNLRWAPCKKAQALTSYNADKELTVIGETRNWYQVQDPQQKYNGFIAKYQVTLSDFGTAE